MASSDQDDGVLSEVDSDEEPEKTGDGVARDDVTNNEGNYIQPKDDPEGKEDVEINANQVRTSENTADNEQPKFESPRSESLSSDNHDGSDMISSGSRRSRVSVNPDDLEALAVGRDSGPPVDGRSLSTESTPRIDNSMNSATATTTTSQAGGTNSPEASALVTALSEAEQNASSSTNNKDDKDLSEVSSSSPNSMPSDSSIVFEKDPSYLEMPSTRRAHSYDRGDAASRRTNPYEEQLSSASWIERRPQPHKPEDLLRHAASTRSLGTSLSQFLNRSKDFQGVDQTVNLMDVSASDVKSSAGGGLVTSFKPQVTKVSSSSDSVQQQRRVLWSNWDDVTLASRDSTTVVSAWSRKSGGKLNANHNQQNYVHTTQKKKNGIETMRCVWMMTCAVLLGIALVVAVIFNGEQIVYHWRDTSKTLLDTGSTLPDNPSTKQQHDRKIVNEVAALVVERGISSQASIMERSHSPQQLAVEWVARTPTTALLWYTDPDCILEWYAMAVLYYEWYDRTTKDKYPESLVPAAAWNQVAPGNHADVAPCQWPGVTCLEDDSIVGLNWTASSLEGTVPEEIHILTDLRVLDLSNNELTGTLPLVLGQLTQLQTFHLHRTNIRGPIPDTVCYLKEEHRLLNLVADCKSEIECDCCDQCY